jgi:hypothetical protein
VVDPSFPVTFIPDRWVSRQLLCLEELGQA